MAITLATANDYFAADAHTMSEVWHSFPAQQRTAAIAEAKRQLCRAIGREVDETASLITSPVREDLATYEQALFLLRNAPGVAVGGNGVPGYLAEDQRNPQQPADVAPGFIAPVARQYLRAPSPSGRVAPMVEFLRG